MDAVPESRRIIALIVIFAVVIVFWMVFHQNASTLTYFAQSNTDWTMFFSPQTAAASGGIISNSINPFWVITLTFPLVWFWGWLDRRGMEQVASISPSGDKTPTLGRDTSFLEELFGNIGAVGATGAQSNTPDNPR